MRVRVRFLGDGVGLFGDGGDERARLSCEDFAGDGRGRLGGEGFVGDGIVGCDEGGFRGLLRGGLTSGGLCLGVNAKSEMFRRPLKVGAGIVDDWEASSSILSFDSLPSTAFAFHLAPGEMNVIAVYAL